jgi:DNA-binding NarL/FixJ family response regulator
MSRIYIYRDCISNEIILKQLNLQFTVSETILLKNISDLCEDAPDEKTVCLITLEQVRNLERNEFHKLIDRIPFCLLIILLEIKDVERIRRLMKTGGKSFLLTDDSVEMIIDCIDKTMLYGGFISPRIVAMMNIVVPEIVQAQYYFTPRRRDVLQELLKGKSDKMIADALKISYQTIKIHRKKIYKILNVRSQGELFALLH